METRILTLFTRTPLHVGAGNSVGAVDAPIMRERHTGFPVIPATTLKGVFADEWTAIVIRTRKTKNPGEEQYLAGERTEDGTWLFGAEDASAAARGAILFGEGRLLAFPIRSAKGAYGWITCPTIVRRAVRDGVLAQVAVQDVTDERAFFTPNGTVGFADKIVLEEYTFAHAGVLPEGLTDDFGKVTCKDPVWSGLPGRLVLVSDGMMSHFATSACEVAQHVRINDATGTADAGGLFNQENVPSETMFYAVLHFCGEKGKAKSKDALRPAERAIETFTGKLAACGNVFQFGGDGSTGLGYCTVELK